MVTKVPPLSTGSNLFGTFSWDHLLLILNHCHPSVFNTVDALTQEFESVLNSGKIGEEGYNIAPIETHDSTQASHLGSAERDFLRFRKADRQSDAVLLHLIQSTEILFYFNCILICQ
ncbi:hypothetical protein AVEN_8968-1 [Araneus ventricosus]|uniref:Uncharacterized protein n=1 Tax=Araneus ventricosus TaxID=182803 RepID=A0A4Y2JSL1_ARAVE|nr:hypothetical protein AVEN_8968-1 [Araneus ventricosus]